MTTKTTIETAEGLSAAVQAHCARGLEWRRRADALPETDDAATVDVLRDLVREVIAHRDEAGRLNDDMDARMAAQHAELLALTDTRVAH